MTWFRSLFYALKQILLKLCIVQVNSSIDWPNVLKENNSKLFYKFIKRNQIVKHAHMKADSESFNLYILMKKGTKKGDEYKCFTLDIVFSIHEPKFLIAMMCCSSKKGPNIHTGMFVKSCSWWQKAVYKYMKKIYWFFQKYLEAVHIRSIETRKPVVLCVCLV